MNCTPMVRRSSNEIPEPWRAIHGRKDKGIGMVTIKLNEHTVEDFKCIEELKALGIPDEKIQEYYDMCYPTNCGEKMAAQVED